MTQRHTSWPAVLVLATALALPAAGAPVAAQVTQLDMLDYFLTDDETIELHTGDPGATLSQSTVGNAVIRVKWRQPQLHEYYTWDSQYIYLRYDSTWDGPEDFTSYEFTVDAGKGGKWMRRYWNVNGTPITVASSNGARWYRDDCTSRVASVNYTNTLVARYPNYYIGGDLGTDDVIVLKYDWDASSTNNYEKFFFSKRWGWIRWEHWNSSSTTVPVDSATWNRISTRTAVPPQPKCVAFPAPCSPPNQSCTGTWKCTGRQCLTQPPGTQCPTSYGWCYAGCCCSCS